jgi:hypothetical protein
MNLRPLTQSDIEELPFPGLDPMRSCAEAMCKYGQGFAVENGGDVIAIGGISKMWQGVGEAWVSAATIESPVAFHRIAKLAIRALAKEMGMHRVHVHSFEEDKSVHRWLKLLGFEHEGKRRGWFFDGRDAEAFALLFPENLR